MNEVKRNDLLYPELSFQIVGCAFEVHNKMGFGFKEAIYQKALSLAFKEKGLSYKEQVLFEIKFKEHVLGNIDQTIEYLRISGLKLALLINFGREGVLSKRLININEIKKEAVLST